jgi:hypothetical protein
MDIQDQIAQEVERAEAGYMGFRRLYVVTTPPPEKEAYQSDNQFIRVVLGIILVASMVVSGSHTIATFANGSSVVHMIVGFAAFCMLELTLAAFAFVGTQRHYRVEQSEPKSFKRFIFAGVVIPFAVMILGNIDDTFHSRGIEIGGGLKIVILLGVGLSGPLLAFIVGDVLAMYSVIDRVQRRRHDKAYQEELKTWEEGLRRSWASKARDYGGQVKVSVDRVPNSIPELSNGMNGMENAGNQRVLPAKSSIGHTKKPMAAQIVKEFFQTNPDALSRDPIEVAAELGVGKSTVYNVIKELRS